MTRVAEPGHTEKRRPQLDSGLQGIQNKIVTMGITTEAMVRDAVESVVTQHQTDERAEEMRRRDDAVDLLDQEAEWEALHLLALQQPVLGYDLRFVGSAIKVITDLERIGDHAVNIAKVAHRIRFANLMYEPMVDLPRFRDMVCRMVAEVTHAFAHRDSEAALAVIAMDDEADVFYAEAVRELRQAMTAPGAPPSRVQLCSHLLFIAHYLERIGDHSCNIAERILFVERGKHLSRSEERARRLTV